MSLVALVHDLADRTPGAVGVVLCDFEGETVVCALGDEPPPAEAEARAREHVPRKMALRMPSSEFLCRLVAAELCGLLRQFASESAMRTVGAVRAFELRYEEIVLVVHALAEDFYVVSILKPWALAPIAHAAIQQTKLALEAEIR